MAFCEGQNKLPLLLCVTCTAWFQMLEQMKMISPALGKSLFRFPLYL